MDIEKFVAAVIGEVLDATAQYYRRNLAELPDEATDPYWIAASSFYSQLPAAQQQLVMRMMQQSAIDAVSYIFGILDGTSSLEGYPDHFRLTYGKKNEQVSGDLQDYFLAAIQDREEESS
jgi:hypothetical protein